MPEFLSLPPGVPLSAADMVRLQRTAGNRAVSRLLGPPRSIQRRTAEPERSDKNKTFTYSMKLYTVDDESYQEAREVAAIFDAFTPTVFDVQTQADYTVRFRINVLEPPTAERVEREFGIELHYGAGRHRVRRKRYREAVERWWLESLRAPGNYGNLYLGNNPPSEETKKFILEMARGQRVQKGQAIKEEFEARLAAARQQNSPSAVDDAKDYWRDAMHDLDKNDPVKKTKARFDAPPGQSKGTTFFQVVTQMRGPRGAQYSRNVRVHETMHLFGLNADYTDPRPSVMSYPYLSAHKEKRVMPHADDIEQLVYVDNPPSMTSAD